MGRYSSRRDVSKYRGLPTEEIRRGVGRVFHNYLDDNLSEEGLALRIEEFNRNIRSPVVMGLVFDSMVESGVIR